MEAAWPAEMPGLLCTNPVLLGTITQAEAETRDPGHTLQPSFPQTSRLPGYFPARFSKEVQEEEGWGNPYEFLENKRRHTKEEQRGREGDSWGQMETAGCCWARRGSGCVCKGLMEAPKGRGAGVQWGAVT